MDKRISQRTSGKLLAAAAAASAGLVGWGTAQQADASLIVDLRATGISVDGGNTILPVVDPKNVIAAPGNIIYMTVTARLTGTDSVQLVGNFDNSAPSTDTKNNDSLGIVSGSLQSVGLLKGNFDPTNVGPNGAAGPGTAAGPSYNPYNGGGSTNGIAVDWDSDGDLDIGTAGTDLTNMFSARAANAQAATIAKSSTQGTRFGVSAGTAFTQDFGGPNSGVTSDKIIDASISEIGIGEFPWTVTTASGTASLNFVPRPTTDSGSALWFEDGATTAKIPNVTGTYAAGAPLVVSVPEPTSLGLLGIAGLGLLARRKKNA